MQLSIAMLGMLVFFLVGIERTENEAVCTIMSLIIQYFTLAAIFWMAAEAVLMFKKLIIVFGELTIRFFLTVSLICWCEYHTRIHNTHSPGHNGFFHYDVIGGYSGC